MIARPGPSLPPAEAARRVASGADPFWLASPAGGADTGAGREVVGCDPVRVVRDGDVEALEAAWAEERAAWRGAPPGVPIAVVLLSYDLGRRFARLPTRARDDHGWPDLEARFHDALWIGGAEGEGATIVARTEEAARRLEARLLAPAPCVPSPRPGALMPDEPAAWYLGAVARIHEYLRAGDVYQVNLARRLRGPAPGADEGLGLAGALRAAAPAPLPLWLARGPADAAGRRPALIGNSPELFLRVDPAGGVETRPIKGTRRREADPAADAAAAAALLGDPKEHAEHVMIVDLERNDLGRVCEPGSVHVEGLLRVVTLPTVHHLVSTVRGRLAPAVGLARLLRATFPGGSISGAPKRRAMEIIEELEPVRRGPYTGATGWLGAAGDLELAVAIRTACLQGGVLSLSVGGGIVIESRAEAELAETEAKAAAFARLCDIAGPQGPTSSRR